MTNKEIYESLIQSKGFAYRPEQIDSHSLYSVPIDHSSGRLAGNSHIHADASPEVQSRVIDELIMASPPPQAPSYPVVDSIFWHPGNPDDPTWQRKCQQWLLQHGYKRPPMPRNYREMRKNLGFPYEEKDIPLL